MRLPFVLMISLAILSVIDDFGIWRLGLDFIKVKNRKSWSRTWWITATICYILLAVIWCYPKRSETNDIHIMMWLLYGYLTIYIAKSITLICGLFGLIPALFKRKRKNSLLWIGMPLGSVVFMVMWWGALVTRNEIEIREINIVSDKIPEAFNGYKIAQLSDMHVGTWGTDTTFISNLVDSVLSQKPDIIFFTGDIVNRHTLELRPFLKTLSRLKAPDGTISVLGNHDYGDYINWSRPSDRTENNALLAAWEKSMGWKLLNNEHIFITHGSDSIPVIGVENWGEPPFKQYGRLEKAYPTDHESPRNVNDSTFKILLSHNPEHWRQEISRFTNIDLTLSGHTHAMQTIIRIGSIEWSPAVFKYEEWGGLYEKENSKGEITRIYVNIGSGEVGMPFRIGATPEVTIITLWNHEPSNGAKVTKARSVK